jgi:uncharacterized protein YbbC (DUF1343 family)
MNFRHLINQGALVTGLVLAFAWSARGAVSLGIDELEKSNFALLQGKRVGLITNPSGADSKGRSAIDVLYHGTGYKLVKLFGPEHGIDGKTEAGLHVSNGRDPKTGLPVCSLYGETRRPTPQMLSGLDVLVYDVQDLGNRSYTFISTLGYVMEEASKYNLEVIVLDRPNPLGGVRIEGPRLDPAVKSFVGLYDIPYIYGLTPGELAQWINSKYLAKPCKLTVVTMTGWYRPMVWEDTGLKWVPTSPNIPTIGAARGYTATGFLGEIGIESGIGSPYPFQIVSGNGWDLGTMVKRFNALHIPGVRSSAYKYRTTKGRWAGASYSGVLLQIDPRNAGNLTAISFQAIQIMEDEVSHFSPFGHTTADQRSMFDKVTGSPIYRRQIIAGKSANDMIRSWDSGVTRWAEERLPYLLYETSRTSRTSGSGVMATSSAAPTP